MTPSDENGQELSGDDALAAEYVLGVLDAAERQAAARRIETDAAFAQLVESWEARLIHLSEDYAEVTPPPSVKQVLDHTLFADGARPAGALSAIWRNIVFWRGLAAAVTAAFILYIGIGLTAPQRGGEAAGQLVASLSADATDVRYLAVYDTGRHEVALAHLSGARAAGHDFELWLIEGGNLPLSLGVIPVGSATHLRLAPAVWDKLTSDAVFAISLEPAGGSPTGQPTGPVVASGAIRPI